MLIGLVYAACTAAATGVIRAMSQMKPASSRAIATTAMVQPACRISTTRTIDDVCTIQSEEKRVAILSPGVLFFNGDNRY